MTDYYKAFENTTNGVLLIVYTMRDHENYNKDGVKKWVTLRPAGQDGCKSVELLPDVNSGNMPFLNGICVTTSKEGYHDLVIKVKKKGDDADDNLNKFNAFSFTDDGTKIGLDPYNAGFELHSSGVFTLKRS